MPAFSDRMFTGKCPHATWRVLVHDRRTATRETMTVECPRGCRIVLTTIEPPPSISS